MVGGAVVSLLHQGLVTFDREGAVAPGLATEWTLSGNGREWRFLLDPKARDSAGNAVGAAEVVASFERVLSPETGSPRAWVLLPIRGADEFREGAADTIAGLREEDGELVIELTRPKASFLGFLAMPNAAVLPAGGDVSGHVTTGPWRLVERVRDSHLRFERNPNWHGTPPSVRTLHVRILPEEFTRVAEFEVGNLDLLEIPETESHRFRDDSRLAGEIHRQVALVTEYIGLNTEDAVLRDPRIRRALNHAVNVEQILATILSGRGERAHGAVPPTLSRGVPAAPYAFDPDRARALLAEAGVPDDWVLELWQRPNPKVSQVLEAVQADLDRVGIRSEIRLRDWSALKTSIDRGETAAFFVNWYADYPDAENFLMPLFHSSNIGGGGNRARFANGEIDARLTELESLADPELRAEAAGKLDRRIHDLAPWIYLWHPVLEVATAPRVEGYRPHPIASAERWLEVELREAPGS